VKWGGEKRMKILGFPESYNKNQNKSFYKRSICEMGVSEKRHKYRCPDLYLSWLSSHVRCMGI